MKKFLFIFFLLNFINLNSIDLKQILHKITFNYFKKVVQKPRVLVFDVDNEIDLKQFALILYNASKDNSVYAIILLINNFGGSAGAFSVIHDLILKIKETKPVIGVIGEGAASGGYLIASACNYIIAHTWSYVGSIGVYSQINKYSNVKLKQKITADFKAKFFKGGAYKAMTNPFSEDLNEDQSKYMNDHIEYVYQEFIAKVADNRKIDTQGYKNWAEGKAFVASEALKLKLIDQIGTFHNAEEKVFELLTKRNSLINKDNIEFIAVESPKQNKETKKSKTKSFNKLLLI